MSSIAYRGPSRPSPESFTPPYGMWSIRYVGTSLINRPPTSRRSNADKVVPILQERGLFRTEYEGETLRDHLGLGVPARR